MNSDDDDDDDDGEVGDEGKIEREKDRRRRRSRQRQQQPAFSDPQTAKGWAGRRGQPTTGSRAMRWSLLNAILEVFILSQCRRDFFQFQICQILFRYPVVRPLVGSLLLRIPRRQERRFVTDRPGCAARDHCAVLPCGIDPRNLSHSAHHPRCPPSLRPSLRPSVLPFPYYRHCGLYFAPIKWNREWMAHAPPPPRAFPTSRAAGASPSVRPTEKCHRLIAAAATAPPPHT